MISLAGLKRRTREGKLSEFIYSVGADSAIWSFWSAQFKSANMYKIQ